MNSLKIKKYSGLILISILPLIIYSILMIFGYGILISSLATLAVIFTLITAYDKIIYTHPLISMLEGKGILILSIDSTGVIQPYVAQVKPPYVYANKNRIRSVFDRKIIGYLKNPKNAIIEKSKEKDITEIRIKFPSEKEKEYIFSFANYPVFIYNKNLEAFISKEDLSKLEMNSSIKHMVFYLKKKTEELTSIMRDFARYVIEMSKPRSSFQFLSSWWFWILVVFGIGAIALLLLPNILHTPNPISAITKNINQTIIK